MSRPAGARGKKQLAREALLAGAIQQHVSKGGRGKLSVAQMLAIAKAGAAGETQAALAAQYGVTQGTISRVQRAMLDTRPYAKQTLYAAAGTLATVAVTASQIAGAMGNAEPALELLDRLDVAPKRAQDAPGAKIVVMVGSQDPSGLPAVLRAPRAILGEVTPASSS